VRACLGPALAAVLQAAASPPVPGAFVDRAAEVGVDFVHRNGMTGRRYVLEIMGSGVALLDFDSDGDLDLYFVQGGEIGTADGPPPSGSADRLYRNEWIAGGSPTGELRFVDVTAAAGIRPTGYGQGVVSGDFDNDGRVDLYRTAYGHNQLLRNVGGGLFVDVTRAAGVDDARWSTAASFLDFDRDGWLDLFVANYVAWAPTAHRTCAAASGLEDYCGPLLFPAETSRLLRNRRDGSFEDVSAASGIGGGHGNALGSAAADFDDDGRADLYVANDQQPNHLWRNRGDGSFAEQALLAGCAVSVEGAPEGSMGVVAADLDGDGHEDLFVTNLTAETNAFYRGDGRGFFDDQTARSGLGPPSLPFTSFGTVDLDYDSDGWLDLFVASGAVATIPEQAARHDPLPLKQSNQLFRNLGSGRFVEVTAAAGDVGRLNVGRGAAVGDLDNDGDPDLVVTRNHERPQVLVNALAAPAWVGLRLLTGSPGRDALGARAALRLADGRTLWRRVRTDGSYLSASDPRLLFGLGHPAAAAVELAVTWPDGRAERWDAAAVPAGRYTTLRQGTGAAIRR
jgi:hypothetical protein